MSFFSLATLHEVKKKVCCLDESIIINELQILLGVLLSIVINELQVAYELQILLGVLLSIVTNELPVVLGVFVLSTSQDLECCYQS